MATEPADNRAAGFPSARRRRRFGITVRALVVLVVVVAGGLGWFIRSVRLQREAVAAVERARGHIGYEWEYQDDQPVPGIKPRAPAPEWLLRWVGVDCLYSVVSVGLYGPGTDADLDRIGKLGHLRQLNILGAQVTDAGLAHLEGITGLRALYLSNMPITDAGLDHLTLSKLRWLSLQNTAITDASLAHLRGSADLEFLSLNGTRITDAGLVHLSGLTSLTELSLENSAVTDAGLANLRRLTRLNTLWLGDSSVSVEGTRELKRSLPNLTINGLR
jgi:internalin A